MKSLVVSATLALMAAAGATAAAQSSAAVAPPAGPQPPPPPRQALTSSSPPPTATAILPGPINATGTNAAYVSAEAIGHPVVFIGSDGTPYGIVGTFSNHPLGFRTNNIAWMFIDTSGNVGIGTPTPGYKLDVNGAINATGLFVSGVAVGAGGSQWVGGSGGTISYSLGNVGIGTPTPHEPLHVVKNGAGGALISASLQSGLQLAAANGTGGYYLGRAFGSDDANDFFLYDATNGKRRFGVTAAGDSFFENGNVGIGTTAPTLGRLQVEGGNSAAVFARSDTNFGVFAYSSIGTGVHGESSGGVGVFGKSSNFIGVVGYSDNNFGVSGNSGNSYGVFGNSGSSYGIAGISFSSYGVFGLSGKSYAGYFEGSVNVTGSLCAANVSCASDARLKEDITPLSYGLREVLRLRPVRWRWKEPSTTQLSLGLVAQDVEPVLPELILRNVDTKGSLGLNYFGFVPIIIKAIQEQQDTITTLTAENTTLKQQNAALDARLTALEQTQRQVLDVSREREVAGSSVSVRER